MTANTMTGTAARDAGDGVAKLTLRFYRLIWLMPAAFALHITEEYVGGFPRWVTQVWHGSMNLFAFDANNAAFMVLMLALTAWTARSHSRLAAFLLIAWCSGNIFWDAGVHIFTTPLFDRYSPGLVTSALLYVPISILVGTATLRGRILTPGQFLGALAAGLALIAVVIWYGVFHFKI